MHPVKGYGFSVGRERAAVRVEAIRKNGKYIELRVVPGSLCVIKPDAIVAPIPESLSVVDTDGNPIQAERQFFISTESFDPYHLVIDGR